MVEDSKIQDYNALVREWNTRFGTTCECIPVESSDFHDAWRQQALALLSTGMSGRQKVQQTVDIMQSFATTPRHPPNQETLTKGELATLIQDAGESILNEYRLVRPFERLKSWKTL